MANQRKANKKQVGGYLDKAIVEEIGKSGMDNTEFIELAVMRGLLIRGRITGTKIKEMGEEGRIKASTVLQLQKEGLVK